jgi:hypothetical protein
MTDDMVERYLAKCKDGEYIYCDHKNGEYFVGLLEGT